MHKERLKFRLYGSLIIAALVIALLPLLLSHATRPIPAQLSEQLAAPPAKPQLVVQLTTGDPSHSQLAVASVSHANAGAQSSGVTAPEGAASNQSNSQVHNQAHNQNSNQSTNQDMPQGINQAANQAAQEAAHGLTPHVDQAASMGSVKKPMPAGSVSEPKAAVLHQVEIQNPVASQNNIPTNRQAVSVAQASKSIAINPQHKSDSADGAAASVQPPPAHVTKASSTISRPWVVQLATFASIRNAQRLQAKLHRAGYAAYIRQVPASSVGRALQQVLIGPQLSRAQAMQVLNSLHQDFALRGFVKQLSA